MQNHIVYLLSKFEHENFHATIVIPIKYLVRDLHSHIFGYFNTVTVLVEEKSDYHC